MPQRESDDASPPLRGKRALPPNATIAILGLDGAGKSTVFAALRGETDTAPHVPHAAIVQDTSKLRPTTSHTPHTHTHTH